MLNNNREVLFQKLIVGLDALLRMNEIQATLDPESYAAGFQGLAGHILNLIRSSEVEGLTPREIIAEIKNSLDDGSSSVIN